MQLDVLIFGGGAAGLWCLDRFRRAGYHALLLESKALGSGQTIQAQGIIHGGGKYALRGVRDFAAVRATSQMPDRWRRCLSGTAEPKLAGTRVLSERCYLWLPRGSLTATIQSWGFIPLLAQTGLLAARPEKVPLSACPPVLRQSAAAVYALDEQVIATGSFLDALFQQNERFIFSYDVAAARFAAREVEISGVHLRPRALVLAAGVGNARLLEQLGVPVDLMQRRPLGMVLLRGRLDPLYGHCVVGGKTQLTITTPVAGVWQVGGEIAERLAQHEDGESARAEALRDIRRWLPELDLAGLQIAIYRAVRAEGRTEGLRRPSGVHVSRVAPQVVLAWPTKLALTPVLADEVFALVTMDLREPAGYNEPMPPSWPKPAVARYPWEEAEWFPTV